MMRAKITPIIGRGAPAAMARTTAQNRMARDWASWRGLKRAMYDEPVLFKMPFFRMRRRELSTPPELLDVTSAVPPESVIGRAEENE
jgi:hypothetical protein